MDKIYQPLWLTLDKKTRDHLARVFGVPTSGIAEIRDQVIISDGRTNADLESITKEKMEEYVGSTADFARLWEITLSKSRFELSPSIGEIKTRVPEEKKLSEEEVKTNVKEEKIKQVENGTGSATGTATKS